MLLRAMNLPACVAGPMRELGRYAVVALLVPGGCLIALALWAFRHRAWLTGRVQRWRELQKPVEPRFDLARAQESDNQSGECHRFVARGSALSPIRADAAVIALMPLLASCASSGLYNMSDEWCASHLDASAARCPENQKGRASRDAPSLTSISDAPGSRAGETLPREASEVGE
jgi:hypothetical protein